MGEESVPGGVPDEAGAESGGEQRAALGLSRRQFIGLGGAGAAGLVVGGVAGHYVLQPSAAATTEAAAPPLRFFNATEAKVVIAMAERIFPADEQGPGATDAHVVNYIDGQLVGGWGTGERMYRQGPFLVPTDTGHGWQYPLTPAQAFRAGLKALGAYTQKQYGKSFDSLSPSQQDDVLTALAGNKVDTFTEIGGLDFFTLFRQTVLEGLFEDPMYGGNHDMIGWKWVGFPGYQSNGLHYADYIDQYDKPFNPAPRSLGQSS